jgi:hypothetical protein
VPIAEKKPVETAEGPAPRDHNRPPVEEVVAMEFREELLSERPDFMTRYENAIAAVDRVAITDEETLGKAGDLEKILRAADTHIAATHRLVKQPYLDGGRAVDQQKNALIGRLSDARLRLGNLMNAFMAEREAKRRAEEARIAAEQRAAAERAAEAERQRQAAERAAEEAAKEAASAEDEDAKEAARIAKDMADAAAIEAHNAAAVAALAPAAPVKAEPVRSDAGSTVSGRTVWNSAVEDYAKAFRAVKTDPKVKEAIDAAIARRVKAGEREIPGVRIWSTMQAVAR